MPRGAGRRCRRLLGRRRLFGNYLGTAAPAGSAAATDKPQRRPATRNDGQRQPATTGRWAAWRTRTGGRSVTSSGAPRYPSPVTSSRDTPAIRPGSCHTTSTSRSGPCSRRPICSSSPWSCGSHRRRRSSQHRNPPGAQATPPGIRQPNHEGRARHSRFEGERTGDRTEGESSGVQMFGWWKYAGSRVEALGLGARVGELASWRVGELASWRVAAR